MKRIPDITDFFDIVTEEVVKNGLKDRFKKRRKEFGITQKELATRSGVSYGSIRRFEQNGEISLYALLSISSILGLLEEFNSLFTNSIVKDIRK